MVGHHIKSRALKTMVMGNTIEDGPDGTASYEVDAPNGGNVDIETQHDGKRTQGAELELPRS